MGVLPDKGPVVVELLNKLVGNYIPISIIVPVLNDADALAALSIDLIDLQSKGHQVVIVDGGSDDETVKIANTFADQVKSSARGRALQMNAGAEIAEHSLYWFLHADSKLPRDADQSILSAYRKTASSEYWGRFDVCMSNPRLAFLLISFFMNLRSRTTGMVTGDQGLFVSRDLFLRAGRYPSIALMEDIAISKELKQFSQPVCLKSKLRISSRRWEKYGTIKTIVLMWGLRMAYLFGVNPNKLHKIYYSGKPRIPN